MERRKISSTPRTEEKPKQDNVMQIIKNLKTENHNLKEQMSKMEKQLELKDKIIDDQRQLIVGAGLDDTQELIFDEDQDDESCKGSAISESLSQTILRKPSAGKQNLI